MSGILCFAKEACHILGWGWGSKSVKTLSDISGRREDEGQIVPRSFEGVNSIHCASQSAPLKGVLALLGGAELDKRKSDPEREFHDIIE